MSLDLYQQTDIARVLAGLVVVAIETHIANGAANVDHIAGILTMGKAVAFSFGLPWPTLIAEIRDSLDPDVAHLVGIAGGAPVAILDSRQGSRVQLTR